MVRLLLPADSYTQHVANVYCSLDYVRCGDTIANAAIRRDLIGTKLSLSERIRNSHHYWRIIHVLELKDLNSTKQSAHTMDDGRPPIDLFTQTQTTPKSKK